jgi:alpha-L-fucosidase
MPDGRIEPRQVTRLEEMGEWLGKYGQTIYGTRGGPWKPGKSVASTRTGNTIYLHLLGWNGETVTLTNIPRKIIRSSALTGGTARVRQEAGTISIQADAPATRPTDPGTKQPPIDTIVKLELDGSAMDLKPL